MLLNQLWDSGVDARQVSELPGGLGDVNHFRARFLHVCLGKKRLSREVCLVTNVAIGLCGSGIKLIDRQAHVVRKRGNSFFQVLDIFFVQAFKARVIRVEYASQAIKVSTLRAPFASSGAFASCLSDVGV